MNNRTSGFGAALKQVAALVAFRSAKGRSFAERKTTLILARSLSLALQIYLPQPPNYEVSTSRAISGGQLSRIGCLPEMPRLTCMTVGGS